MVATAEVRSVMQPANDTPPKGGSSRDGGTPQAKPPAASQDPTVPGMLKDDQPVYVTGAALDYDGARSFATYTGGARLWQGDTTIQGDTIVLDEHERRSEGQRLGALDVRARTADEKTQQKTKVPSIASAQGPALRGRAAPRHVHDRRARERAAGRLPRREDRVVLRRGRRHRSSAPRPTGREAAHATHAPSTGDRMTYFAADERYIMVGAPVSVDRRMPRNYGQNLDLLEID